MPPERKNPNVAELAEVEKRGKAECKQRAEDGCRATPVQIYFTQTVVHESGNRDTAASNGY
jgi:hypothetical protein